MQPRKTENQNRPLRPYRTYPPYARRKWGWAGKVLRLCQNAELFLQVREPRMDDTTAEARQKTSEKFLPAVWAVRHFLHCCLVRKIQFSSLSLRSANENYCLFSFSIYAWSDTTGTFNLRWSALTPQQQSLFRSFVVEYRRQQADGSYGEWQSADTSSLSASSTGYSLPVSQGGNYQVRASAVLSTGQRVSMASNFRHLAGIRTVPVLSVAKESQPDRRLAAEHPNTGRSMLTDWSTIKCQETFEFCPFVDVSFSSRRNHRAWDACRVFKADVLRESKNSAWFPSSEIDDRSWPLSVFVRVVYCEAEFDLGTGKNRSKATYPHWKDENNNDHWQTNPNSHVYESESQSEVDVRWPAMYA